VMAQDDDGRIWIQFLVGPARNVAHGNIGASGNLRGRHFDWFTHVQQQGRVGLSTQRLVLFRGDLWWKHSYKDTRSHRA
jgi:hypothetical protein